MIITNKNTSVTEEEWLIDARNPFEEFESCCWLNGVQETITAQAQPPDENGTGVRFLIIGTKGQQSYLEYDNELKGWMDSSLGETAETKLIGAEVEKHMQFDDSPQEDAGIDNPEETDPSQPFTGWYKLFGKKHRIRIEPVLASPCNHYHIYNLDRARDSDTPERILYYNFEVPGWVEMNTEPEHNHWLCREKGYSLYSWIIGHILDAVQ